MQTQLNKNIDPVKVIQPKTTQVQKEANHKTTNPFLKALQKAGIQTKLSIGQANDQYEQEADRIADQVVSMPDSSLVQKKDIHPSIQTKSLASQITSIGSNFAHRKCEACQAEEKLQGKFIQRETSATPPTSTEEPESTNQTQQCNPCPRQETPPEQSPGSNLASQVSPLTTSYAQRKCADCAAEEKLQGKFIQMKGEADVASNQLENQINSSKGGGNAMDANTQSFMSDRFGTDFSGVRIHTGSESVQMNQDLGAKAFTVGNDIHFNQGQYNPSSTEGKKLLAHELTHTVQQGGVQLKRIQKSLDNIIQMRTNLGYSSWTSTFMGRRTIRRDVIALTQQEWDARLRNLDEESEYRAVQGFLECAIDPSIATQTRHPNGWPDYVNRIRRAPNLQEILNFMRALYNVGSDLDLPDGGWGDDGGPFRLSLRRQIATLISRYQGYIIQEFSEQGRAIPEANIAAIVDETNADYVLSRGVMTGIINNAGATAMKALDMAVTANNYTDQTQRENSLATAYEMVRNSGRTIRYAITQESVQIQFNQAVVSNVFDIVWGTLPGGGVLVGAAKDILKLGLKKMIEEASKQNGSTAQAEELNNNFVYYANQLVRQGHTTSAIIQPAINGFEAVRR